MYELLTRRESYLLFLAVGGDAAQLPEPLTPAEYFLHDKCLRKAKGDSEDTMIAGEISGELVTIIDPVGDEKGSSDNVSAGADAADPAGDDAEVNKE